MLARPLHRIPSQPDLTQTLRGLLGLTVSLSRTEPGAGRGYLAVYSDQAGNPVNVIGVDLAFAASAAAGLAMVPVAQVDEWLAAGSLPEDAVENLYEVLNVLAATHNPRDGSRHVKLTALLAPEDVIPAEVAAGRASPELAVWFTAEVPGYPGGLIETAAF